MDLDFGQPTSPAPQPISTLGQSPSTQNITPVAGAPTEAVNPVVPEQIPTLEMPPSTDAVSAPATPPPAPTPTPAPAPEPAAPLPQAETSPADTMVNINKPVMPVAPLQKVKKSSAGLWVTIIILILILGGAAYYFLMTDSGKALIGLSKSNPSSTSSTNLLNPSTTGTTTPTTTSTNATAATRDKQRKADILIIKTALNLYYNDNMSYPVAAATQKAGDTTSTIYQALVPKYLATMPNDPFALDQGRYYGYVSADGTTATLTSWLEDTTDPSTIQINRKAIYSVAVTPNSSASTSTSTTSPTTSSASGTSTSTTTSGSAATETSTLGTTPTTSTTTNTTTP